MQAIVGSFVRFGWLAMVLAFCTLLLPKVLADKTSFKCMFYISLLVEVFEAVHNIVVCLHEVGHLLGRRIRFIFPV